MIKKPKREAKIVFLYFIWLLACVGYFLFLNGSDLFFIAPLLAILSIGLFLNFASFLSQNNLLFLYETSKLNDRDMSYFLDKISKGKILNDSGYGVLCAAVALIFQTYLICSVSYWSIYFFICISIHQISYIIYIMLSVAYAHWRYRAAFVILKEQRGSLRKNKNKNDLPVWGKR